MAYAVCVAFMSFVGIDITPKGDAITFHKPGVDKPFLVIPTATITTLRSARDAQCRLESYPWCNAPLSMKFEMLAVAHLFKLHLIGMTANRLRDKAESN
jgi:hypothetical protein